MCFMVLVELDKSALTEDYIKYPSITAGFSKHHLLDVLTTFQANRLHEPHQEKSTDYLFH